MTMLRIVLFAGVFITLTSCQTLMSTRAHRTRPPHESSEHSSITFVYEPSTHKFVISTSGSCYVFTLTSDERVAVHTDMGMKSLQLKLAGMIDTANKTSVNKEDLNNHVVKACARGTSSYYTMTM